MKPLSIVSLILSCSAAKQLQHKDCSQATGINAEHCKKFNSIADKTQEAIKACLNGENESSDKLMCVKA